MPENMILTLKQWRGLREISQRELAIKSGINERSIVNYESDVKRLRNAQYSTIKRIADVLEIEVSNIFLDDTSEKPKQEVR